MCRKNECDGLSPEKLEYTNKTKKIGPIILNNGEIIIWMKHQDLALPISVSTVANSFKIKGLAIEFILLPPMNALSDFED